MSSLLEHCRVVMEFEQSSNGKEWNEFKSEPNKALIFDIGELAEVARAITGNGE